MAFEPLISIVIPVYNGSNFLREAIDSALGQTYPHKEVIVVNDGSNDDGKTERLALSYGSQIRYFVKPNGGVASALNLGIREMRGEYFSWLSHDDVYRNDKLSNEVRWLREHPDDVLSKAILFADIEIIDETGKYLRTQDNSLRPGETIALACLCRYPLNGCAMLVDRACFDPLGPFDEALRTTQDYDLWFRLARQFPFVHLALPLTKSRVHSAQGTVTISHHGSEIDSLYIRALKALPVAEVAGACSPPSIAWGYFAIGRQLCFDKRAMAASRYCFALAWKSFQAESLLTRVRVAIAIWSIKLLSMPIELAAYCFRTLRRWISLRKLKRL